MEMVSKLKEKAEEVFFNDIKGGCHDFDHTLRVYNLCLHIAALHGYLPCSSLLH